MRKRSLGLREALRVRPGVTAVIGGGGKTTLLLALARELALLGRVILCATAKMYPPEGIRTLFSPSPLEIAAALKEDAVVCVGDMASDGKITQMPEAIPTLALLSDYVLCEADGSKGLPLKAHAPHEPVIPKEAGNTVLVIGIDGIGKPVIEAAHRAERYAALLDVGLYHIVTPADVARVAQAEALHTCVFINKVETPAQLSLAKDLAANLSGRVAAGALQKGEVCLLS